MPASLRVHRLSAAGGVCTGATFTLANFTKGCGKTPRFVLRSTEGKHCPDTGFLAGSSGLPEGSKQHQLSSLPGRVRPSSARRPHLRESGKGTLEKLLTCGACTPPGGLRGDDDWCPREPRSAGQVPADLHPSLRVEPEAQLAGRWRGRRGGLREFPLVLESA